MPVTIFNGEQRIDWVCDDHWDMPTQIKGLEAWLVKNVEELTQGNYMADLGYSPRQSAAGGGVTVTKNMMELMLKIGMELSLSEYPVFCEEE